MADIVSELASRCGISADTARKGLGVVFGLLKNKLPADSFNKLSDAVPGADDMMNAAENTADESGGGVVGAVKGAIGKIFGGNGAGAALAKLSQIGMTPDQITNFIPKVLEYLKGKLPENILGHVKDVLPTPQEAAH
jgi:hypothetical protein